MMMDMQGRVVEVLNGYLAENLEKVELLGFEELERYRQNFLAKFGPDRLARMSKEELLLEMPFNVSSRDSMDRWLDSKDDEEFRNGWFGSISGGWSTNYVVWQTKALDWKVVKQGKTFIASADEAIEIVDERRRELLAGVNAVAGYEGKSAGGI